MAKAILEFNLEDSYDRESHLRCIKSLDMTSALHDIAWLWKDMERFYENTEGNEDDSFEVIGRYKERISKILNNNGLNLEQLIS